MVILCPYVSMSVIAYEWFYVRIAAEKWKKNYFSGRISVADPLDEIKRSQFKDQTNKFKIDNSTTPQKKYDLVNLKCCPVCEQTFKYLTSLFKHLINIHNVEKESINIICTKCHSDFQDVKTYKGHLYKAVCKYWIIDHDSSSFEQIIYY